MLLADPRDGLADAAGHRLAGAIRNVARLARPAADAVGGRELVGDELDFLAELRARPVSCTRWPPRARPAAPPAARGTRQRACGSRISPASPRPGATAPSPPRARPAFRVGPGGELGGVKLPPLVAEEMGDVLQALRVLQTEALPLVGDRPEVAVSPKDRGRYGGPASRAGSTLSPSASPAAAWSWSTFASSGFMPTSRAVASAGPASAAAFSRSPGASRAMSMRA